MRGLSKRCILVTGASGFIGKNLVMRLSELEGVDVLKFTRTDGLVVLPSLVDKADIIVHLAGENRPVDQNGFAHGNVALTQAVCDFVAATGRQIPLIFTSSTQVLSDTAYGKSKRQAEEIITKHVSATGNSATIYRLPGVFGKWCRPDYNSVVATFCHNVANGLPIRIDDASVEIKLVYIDDLIDELLARMANTWEGVVWGEVSNIYRISVGDLAEKIYGFKHSRDNLMPGPVGVGFLRALYSTYISYLSPEQFSYGVPIYADARGLFVEMLKTRDSGQFSFFTVHPGVTRGSHYHHTKTEKFLVVKGEARLRFRSLLTQEAYEIFVSGNAPRVIDTIPGWVHDITNIGTEEMIVVLWANELFDREKPDCISQLI